MATLRAARSTWTSVAALLLSLALFSSSAAQPLPLAEAPSRVRLTAAENGTLLAEWQPAPGATSYEAVLAEDIAFTRVITRHADLRATRCVFKDLRPDRVYHLRVSAQPAAGAASPAPYPIASRGTVTDAPRGFLVLNVYSEALLNAVTSDGFERFARAGDIFLVVDGNTGRIADVARLNRLIDGLVEHYLTKHRIPIKLGIYTTEKIDVDFVLRHLADGSYHHAEAIAYLAAGYEPQSRERVDYEPYPPLGGFYDDLAQAVPYVRALGESVHRQNLKFMLIPTGRPLGRETKKFNTNGEPGWDYARFVTEAGVDFVLIQMQALAHSGGVDRLQERYAQAKTLFDRATVPEKMWNGQVSIQRSGNSVDVPTGVACISHMLTKGGGYSASIWTSGQDRAMLVESVQRLRAPASATRDPAKTP